MNRPKLPYLILFITLVQSFAGGFVENGIFFLGREHYGFGDAANLVIALIFGLVYVVGALMSHSLAERIGTRRLMTIALVAQFILHAGLALDPMSRFEGASRVVVLTGLNAALGFAFAIKWPIVESYVTAGRTPREASRSLGVFNLTWAPMVFIGVAASGVIIDNWPMGLFLIPAGINLVVLALIPRLPSEPVHLPDDHPERPVDDHQAWLNALLTSSRWSMMSSYALTFLLGPLFPGIFDRLGVALVWATVFASLIHFFRFGAFAWMTVTAGWHDKATGLVWTCLSIPIGCVMVLLGDHLAWVILGQVIFGLGTGYAYYAALYYAVVIKNASVEAGGGHEGMIGLGFTLGPLMGLIGIGLAQLGLTHNQGVIAAITPFIGICLAASLWPLMRVKRPGSPAPPSPARA